MQNYFTHCGDLTLAGTIFTIQFKEEDKFHVLLFVNFVPYEITFEAETDGERIMFCVCNLVIGLFLFGRGKTC